MEKVELLGFWPSPFTQRIILALKFKGIDYDYIEEDISNKSQLLLKYNPIHKKVPILVHQGKPICESHVILEYIEDIWPQNPLLPKDACERASARFWIQFTADMVPTFGKFFRSSANEEDGKKAAQEALELLKILEEKALGNNKFFGGETINMVDIANGWFAHWFDCIEEIVGLKLVEPTTLPRLCAWIQNLKNLPLIKVNLPSRDRLMANMKSAREKMISDSISA